MMPPDASTQGEDVVVATFSPREVGAEPACLVGEFDDTVQAETTGVVERIPHGRYIDLDNGTTAFVRTTDEHGSGPPILLLHGLGATGALNWADCFEPLAAFGQVVAMDHRGHGRGPRVGLAFRLADCADDAAAVLRALGLGPAIVMGYSMGGPIAQLLAQRHPEAVAGLVMCATARDFSGRISERVQFAAIGTLAAAVGSFGPSQLAPAVIPVLPGRLRPVGWALAEVRRHEPVAVMSAAASLGRFTSRTWIGDLDVPTTVIVHTRDRVVPPNRQLKLAAALPDAEVHEVDADHNGINRERDRYLPALLDAHASVVRRAA